MYILLLVVLVRVGISSRARRCVLRWLLVRRKFGQGAGTGTAMGTAMSTAMGTGRFDSVWQWPVEASLQSGLSSVVRLVACANYENSYSHLHASSCSSVQAVMYVGISTEPQAAHR